MADIMVYILQISWQAALLAAVVWVITRINKKAPAAWRHALWVVVLVKLFVPPFVDLSLLPATHLASQVQSIIAPKEAAITNIASSETVERSQYTNGSIPSTSVVQTVKGNFNTHPIMLLLGMFWIAGIIVMVGRFNYRYRKQKRVLAGSMPASSNISNLLVQCASRLGITRLPEIKTTELASVPMLLGVFHPTILVHPDMAESQCESELSVMIMHELAHMKRYDTMFAWVVQIAQTLFFFHPAVWLAGWEIRKEREIAADEIVLSASGIDRFEYASGYVSALRLANGLSIGDTALAMAESTEIEERRLKMILRSAIPKMSRAWITGLVVVTVLGLTTFRSLAPRSIAQADRALPVAAFVAVGMRTRPVPAITDPTLDSILNGIRRNLDNISSAQGKMTLIMRYGDSAHFEGIDTKVNDQSYKYALIFAKEGYYEERTDITKGQGVLPEVRAFDGADGYDWSPSINSGAVHSSTNRPQGWRSEVSGWLDLGYKHFPDTYKSEADYILADNPTLKGKEFVGDIECYRIEGSDENVKHIWWIAPSRGFCVIKHEWSNEWESDGKVSRNRFIRVKDHLTSYQDGVWLPSKITLTCLVTKSGGNEQFWYEYIFTIGELTINEPVDTSKFTIKFPSGTKVIW